MPVQVMFGFTAQGPGKLKAWTESHFLPATTTPDDATAKTKAVELANARVDLLGSGVSLEVLRLSNTDKQRDSVKLPVGETNNPLSARVTPDTATLTAYGRADLTNVAVHMRMGLDSKKWKNFYCAGVPDLLTNTALKTVDIGAVPLWLTKYNIWKGIIAPASGSSWGFKGLQLPAGAFAPKPIQDYTTETVAPNRIGIVMLTADTGWASGTKIHIRNVVLLNNAYRTPVGVWTIGGVINDGATGKSTYFLRNTEGINVNNIKELGTAEVVDKTYFSYQFCDILGLGTRKRGVGASASRGKSRKKVARV